MKQLRCDAIDLFVVESVGWVRHRSAECCWGYGLLEPVAVVVGENQRIHAYDMRAKEINVEPLRVQLPELDAALTHFLNQ